MIIESPTNSNCFSFPLRVWVTKVLLYVNVLYDSCYKHKEGRACTTLIYLDHSYTLDLKASQTASDPTLFRKLYWRD